MSLDLKQLKDEELLKKLKSLAAQERELTTAILHHLQEIEVRRLFAKRGFASLFEYCTLELGYSAASAQRRIASMRLLRTIPEMEEKIATGVLNLSNIAQAAKFFQNEAKSNKPLSVDDQKKVLKDLEGKSTRDVERDLAGKSSNPQAFLNQDRIKPITKTHSEIRFVAEQSLVDDLEKIKGLLAHKNSNLTTAELIAEIARIALEKLETSKFAKKKGQQNKGPAAGSSSTSGAGTKPVDSVQDSQINNQSTNSTDIQTTSQARYIRAEVKRAVYERDGQQCTYVDSVTGRRCESRFRLEFEHLKPWALGGASDATNITLRCRHHNLLSAINTYKDKMKPYLKY